LQDFSEEKTFGNVVDMWSSFDVPW